MAHYRALVQERFPAVPVDRCEPVPGGWDHYMLLVNDEWIFRFPRRPENEATLRREAALVPALAPTLPVAVPRFDHVWRGDAPPRIVLGYRRIPGRPLSAQPVSEASVASLGAQLAGFLTSLHGFPVDRARDLGAPGGDAEAWRREYEDFFRWIRREAFPVLGRRERRWATDLCEDFLASSAHFRFTPVLLHRDLGMDHVLFDETAGQITGVIDWGDASLGDPAFDITGILADLGEGMAQAVLEGYRGPKGPGMIDRARFYAEIIPFYGIIYGRQLGHDEWYREGLQRLEALVE
jgi:aminoglycoside 2''-phosphotransferase